jgi:1,2-diacylglycerol 3-alpha-glucosyltransferase
MVCDFFHEDQQYQENILIKYYLKHGHDIVVIASTFTSVFKYYAGNYCKNSVGSVYSVNGYMVVREPYTINIFNRLRKLSNIKKILNEFLPDVIYVHGMPLNLIDPVAYKKANSECRVIYDSHADYSNSATNWISLYFLHKLIYKTIFKIYDKYIDKFFYITPDGGVFIEKVYNMDRDRISLLPLGADMDYIESVKKSDTRGRIRHDLGIGVDDLIIFTGGKIKRKKKIELLINAFKLIKSTLVQLVIVGDTNNNVYKNELLALIANDSRIHFIGWVDGLEVYDYLCAADVAVFPYGQTVLWQQAIGTGLPLILGQHPGQDASYLNKNNNILLIGANELSAERICKELTSLYKNKEKLFSMKMAAKKTAIDFLSYEKIAQQTLE